MGKRARTKARISADETPLEGSSAARQPCPCGSGARFKHCHGATGGPAPRLVSRPFAGLEAECDLVALRELVPAASAPLTWRDDAEITADVTLCTLLPMAAPALVRADGAILLGLQVQHSFGDPSRELVAVLEAAISSAAQGETGMVGLTSDPGEGRRLQDVLAAGPLTVTVHEGFDFWVADSDEVTGSLRASLDQANVHASPTARLAAAEAAYWTSIGTKEHLRWVLPYDEDAVLTAFARLHAAGTDGLVAGSRLVGMFRAHGLAVPVWDLEVGTGSEALEEPLAGLRAAFEDALAATEPLTSAERSARAGLANRQVTIR